MLRFLNNTVFSHGVDDVQLAAAIQRVWRWDLVSAIETQKRSLNDTQGLIQVLPG